MGKIEQAARALCELDGKEPTEEAWEAALVEARRFVRMLEAVTPRPAPDVLKLRRSGGLMG